MTEKRQEFLNSLQQIQSDEDKRIADLPDRGNVIMNARMIAREEAKAAREKAKKDNAVKER